MRLNMQRLAVMLLALMAVCACAFAFQSKPAPAKASAAGAVIINITTGPDDVFRLLSAFHVAEDAINDGRRVVLFFNGRGVTVPVKRLSGELQLGQERALWVVLQDLVQAGAEVLVARESMRALNMVEADFITGTQIGDWGGSVLGKITAGSVVFSY